MVEFFVRTYRSAKGDLSLRFAAKNEFLFIIGLSVVLILVISFTQIQFLRVLLGLPFVLFFPGYTLIAALFPGKSDLDGIERVALSFGLSIAVVPLIGLGLNYTPWGIRLYPILVSLVVFITAMSVIADYRRKRIKREDRFELSLEINPPQWGKLSRLDKVLSVALVFAILFAVGSIVYVVTTPKVGEKFTEFYILGPGGMAEGYPRELKTGEPGKVILGVVNHEYREIDYSVEVRMGGSLKKKLYPIALAHEEKWEKPITFRANQPHKNLKVEFLLYREGDKEPYRKLHLWVDVIQNE